MTTSQTKTTAPAKKAPAKPKAPAKKAAAIVVTDAASGAARRAAAKDEAAKLKAWTSKGEKGRRPATPNLDAIEADKGKTAKERVQGAPKGGGRVSSNPRRAAANEVIKRTNNHRGPGRRVSDDELTAWIKATLAEDPTRKMHDEQQYCYWVDGIACGLPRFRAAWDAFVAEQAKPKRRTRKAA